MIEMINMISVTLYCLIKYSKICLNKWKYFLIILNLNRQTLASRGRCNSNAYISEKSPRTLNSFYNNYPRDSDFMEMKKESAAWWFDATL